MWVVISALHVLYLGRTIEPRMLGLAGGGLNSISQELPLVLGKDIVETLSRSTKQIA